MKDLNGFLKEEDKSKPHKVKKEEGADDKKYFALMSEYKVLRRTDRKKADKIFNKALKLKREGDVSKNAKLGAAYL
jgi:hypothetical protein